MNRTKKPFLPGKTGTIIAILVLVTVAIFVFKDHPIEQPNTEQESNMALEIEQGIKKAFEKQIEIRHTIKQLDSKLEIIQDEILELETRNKKSEEWIEAHKEGDVLYINGKTFSYQTVKNQLNFESKEVEKYKKTEQEILDIKKELKEIAIQLKEEMEKLKGNRKDEWMKKKGKENDAIRNEALTEVKNSKKLIEQYSEKENTN